MRKVESVEQVILGRFYMVDFGDGQIQSLRLLSETPTHFIFSNSPNEKAAVVVFPKAKKEVAGIYEVNEWWKVYGNDEK